MSETPKPTLSHLPLKHHLPTPPPTHFVHLIRNLLTPTECQSIITSHTNLKPANVTPTTIRLREAFDDASLSAVLWSRLSPFYAEHRLQDSDNQWWRATGLNVRFRLCKYELGGKFSPHVDGRYMRNVNEMSWMTVNLYLNTVDESCGGATRVLSDEMGEPRGVEAEVLGKVQPVLGMAAVFRDCVWHDGEALSAGEKYLLRTDVMYEREVPFDFEKSHSELDADSQGVRALALAEALEDAGDHMQAIEWYKKAFKLAPRLEKGPA